jgi:hypothetical protein
MLRAVRIQDADIRKKTVQRLLDRNEDVDALENGLTPLIAAVLDGRTEIVKMLLNGGADPNKNNGNGCYPITVAALQEDWDMVKILLLHDADAFPALEYFVAEGFMDMTKTLVSCWTWSRKASAVGKTLKMRFCVDTCGNAGAGEALETAERAERRQQRRQQLRQHLRKLMTGSELRTASMAARSSSGSSSPYRPAR